MSRQRRRVTTANPLHIRVCHRIVMFPSDPRPGCARGRKLGLRLACHPEDRWGPRATPTRPPAPPLSATGLSAFRPGASFFLQRWLVDRDFFRRADTSLALQARVPLAPRGESVLKGVLAVALQMHPRGGRAGGRRAAGGGGEVGAGMVGWRW